MTRRLIILLAIFGVVIVGLFASYGMGSFATHVYVSGQKANIRADESSMAIKTTICFWTPSLKEAALAASNIVSQDKKGFITGPGFVSLTSDTSFYDQMKFDKANEYGILAKSLTEGTEIVTPGNKYPVLPPKKGPAVIYLSDELDSQAKEYDIEITYIDGDNFAFAQPNGRKLTYYDTGSPIVQNNALVGAAQVTEFIGKGLSAPIMYRELFNTKK